MRAKGGGLQERRAHSARYADLSPPEENSQGVYLGDVLAQNSATS